MEGNRKIIRKCRMLSNLGIIILIKFMGMGMIFMGRILRFIDILYFSSILLIL
jgi:hypothetical protein